MNYYKRLLDTAGKIHASPVTLIGIIVGVLLMKIFGGRVTVKDNAINFITNWTGQGAITLGNTIIYANGTWNPNTIVPRYDFNGKVRVGKHEKAHTYQQQVLGMFFWIIYPLLGGPSANNPVEKAADDYADPNVNGNWWKLW